MVMGLRCLRACINWRHGCVGGKKTIQLGRVVPRSIAVARGSTDRAGIIHRWIQVHHREEALLDDLAQELGLSRFQASRTVRTATGHGFAELLLSARLNTARALLRETDLPVVDIALRRV